MLMERLGFDEGAFEDGFRFVVGFCENVSSPVGGSHVMGALCPHFHVRFCSANKFIISSLIQYKE